MIAQNFSSPFCIQVAEFLLLLMFPVQAYTFVVQNNLKEKVKAMAECDTIVECSEFKSSQGNKAVGVVVRAQVGLESPEAHMSEVLKEMGLNAHVFKLGQKPIRVLHGESVCFCVPEGGNANFRPRFFLAQCSAIGTRRGDG